MKIQKAFLFILLLSSAGIAGAVHAAETSCSSDETKNGVISKVRDQLYYQINKGMFDIRRSNFELDGIRTAAVEFNKRTCKTNLLFNIFMRIGDGDGGQFVGDRQMEISYTIETTDDGKPYITIYGLDDLREVR